MFLLVPRGQNAVLSVLCSLLVTLNQRSSLPLFLFPCCELKKCHDFLIEVTLVVTKQAGFEKKQSVAILEQSWEQRCCSRGCGAGPEGAPGVQPGEARRIFFFVSFSKFPFILGPGTARAAQVKRQNRRQQPGCLAPASVCCQGAGLSLISCLPVNRRD